MKLDLSVDPDSAAAAIGRLFDIAHSDTGQARKVANFLLAWWHGDAFGHFPVTDVFGLDRTIAQDITIVIAYLGQRPDAVYPDAFVRRSDIVDLIDRWRPETSDTA